MRVSQRRGKFACPLDRYFSQITLTSKTYLFNSAKYITASKTVACKQHCRFEPRNLSVFFFNRTADTVVCHFYLRYRWLKKTTRVIRNYIRDVNNYLKTGFSLKRCICLVLHAMRNSHGQIPLRWGKSGIN